MVGLPGHNDPAPERSPPLTQVLVLLWDLLFAEGSIVLLKVAILLIDEFTPLIFTCQDTSTSSPT